MINNNFYESFLKPVISKKDSSDVAFCIRDKVYSYAQLFDAAEQIYDCRKTSSVYTQRMTYVHTLLS